MATIDGVVGDATSFLGGIVNCLIDEVMGLVDLAKLLGEIRADLDLAADGEIDHPITFLSQISKGGLEEALKSTDAEGLTASGILGLNPVYQAGSVATDLARAFGGDWLEELAGREMTWLTGENDALRDLHKARLIAKFEAVRDALVEAMNDGCNFLAAYDLNMSPTKPWSRKWGGLRSGYSPLDTLGTMDRWAESWNSETKEFDIDLDKLEEFLPAGVDAVLDTLAAAVSFFFEEDDWQRRATQGRADLENLIKATRTKLEADPWGSAGYAVCLIVLTIIPVTAVTKVTRVLKSIFRTIDAAADAADVARVAGRMDVADEIARAERAAADEAAASARAADEAAAARAADDETPAQRGETPDNEAERAEDPNENQAPPPNRNTTEILDSDNGKGHRSRIAGALGEERALQDFEAEIADMNAKLPDGSPQWEIVDLKYGSDNGIDLGAIRRNSAGDIAEIELREVKSVQNGGSPEYSKNERLGGAGMLRHILSTQTLNNRRLQAELLAALQKTTNPISIKSEIVKYDVDLDGGTVSQARRKPWEKGNSQRFQLDSRTTASSFDSRAELRKYLESLSPSSLAKIYEANPLLETEFPDLKP